MKSKEIIVKIEGYLEDLENLSSGPESLPAIACGNIRDLLTELTPAPAERWETVEQWEKRTGKVYPDDGPAWGWLFDNDPGDDFEGPGEYFLAEYVDVKDNYVNLIVANHHGKPPC